MPPTIVDAAPLPLPLPLLLLPLPLLREEVKGNLAIATTFAAALPLAFSLKGGLPVGADRSACTEISSACLADSIVASASTLVMKLVSED